MSVDFKNQFRRNRDEVHLMNIHPSNFNDTVAESKDERFIISIESRHVWLVDCSDACCGLFRVDLLIE